MPQEAVQTKQDFKSTGLNININCREGELPPPLKKNKTNTKKQQHACKLSSKLLCTQRLTHAAVQTEQESDTDLDRAFKNLSQQDVIRHGT